MLFDHEHPSYGGDIGLGINPKIVQCLTEADLILLVGGRLSEVPSQGYSLLQIPNPQQQLIHVHPDPNELGRIYAPDFAINATPVGFAAALSSLPTPAQEPWAARTVHAHRDYLAWSDPKAVNSPGPLQLADVVRQLQQAVPDDAIVANGAGNFTVWVHRFWRHRRYGTQLAPTAGSMGYGVPAAIGIKRLYPDRTVVAFTGDGDFLMTGQDFATAVQYGLPVIIVLVDNGMYGTIRMHQEVKYPARISATTLRNPDFVDYARAFGGYGERVVRTEDFPSALQRARDSKLPSILHCVIDPEVISPSTTLTALRERALSKERSH
jgi:acetolactate synthase-1/2/3 large subunit